jgi:hypothetical protein
LLDWTLNNSSGWLLLADPVERNFRRWRREHACLGRVIAFLIQLGILDIIVPLDAGLRSLKAECSDDARSDRSYACSKPEAVHLTINSSLKDDQNRGPDRDYHQKIHDHDHEHEDAKDAQGRDWRHHICHEGSCCRE